MFGNTDTQIVPEIEVGKSCSILVMPVNGDLTDSQVNLLLELERKCLYFSYRSDSEENFWRLFVIPFRFSTTGGIYKDICKEFGIPKFYDKVC